MGKDSQESGVPSYITRLEKILKQRQEEVRHFKPDPINNSESNEVALTSVMGSRRDARRLEDETQSGEQVSEDDKEDSQVSQESGTPENASSRNESGSLEGTPETLTDQQSEDTQASQSQEQIDDESEASRASKESGRSGESRVSGASNTQKSSQVSGSIEVEKTSEDVDAMSNEVSKMTKDVEQLETLVDDLDGQKKMDQVEGKQGVKTNTDLIQTTGKAILNPKMEGKEIQGEQMMVRGKGGNKDQLDSLSDVVDDFAKEAAFLASNDIPNTDDLSPSNTKIIVPQMTVSQMGMPQMGIPQKRMPQIMVPQMEMPQSGMPQMMVPQTSMPQMGMPQTRMPQMGMPQTRMPQMMVPQMGIPPMSMPRPSASQKENRPGVQMSASNVKGMKHGKFQDDPMDMGQPTNQGVPDALIDQILEDAVRRQHKAYVLDHDADESGGLFDMFGNGAQVQRVPVIQTTPKVAKVTTQAQTSINPIDASLDHHQIDHTIYENPVTGKQTHTFEGTSINIPHPELVQAASSAHGKNPIDVLDRTDETDPPKANGRTWTRLRGSGNRHQAGLWLFPLGHFRSDQPNQKLVQFWKTQRKFERIRGHVRRAVKADDAQLAGGPYGRGNGKGPHEPKV